MSPEMDGAFALFLILTALHIRFRSNLFTAVGQVVASLAMIAAAVWSGVYVARTLSGISGFQAIRPFLPHGLILLAASIGLASGMAIRSTDSTWTESVRTMIWIIVALVGFGSLPTNFIEMPDNVTLLLCAAKESIIIVPLLAIVVHGWSTIETGPITPPLAVQQ